LSFSSRLWRRVGPMATVFTILYGRSVTNIISHHKVQVQGEGRARQHLIE